MEFTHEWWKHSAGFNIHTMGTNMSAQISWSQLCSWWTWFTWQSGELGSEQRFSMGCAASLTSASIESGWVRLRGWSMVGLSMLVLFDLATSPHGFWLKVGPNSPQRLLGFGSLLLHLWFRLIQTGRPLSLSSVFIWQRVTLSDSGVSPPRLSMNVPVQSTSVTACESCSMSSDARCACRCQGGYLCCRTGHRSPPLCLCLSSPFFPSFFSLLQSFYLPPPLTCLTLPLLPPSPSPSLPPLFSLLCTTR